MATPKHLSLRLRSLLSRIQGKLKPEANMLACLHLPLKRKTIQLAEDQ